MAAYATLADAEARYPRELIVLAADEQTGVRDDVRIVNAMADATSEIRGILKGRYSPRELDRLDADSLEMLRIYCIDIALYRIALSFARSNERIQERYDASIKRLERISDGKGALTFEGGGDDPTTPAGGASTSPNEVLIDAPPRFFDRRRMGSL